ncbi:hypothetical protein EV644_13168 [Kribbella orskensis]|uniref:Uncharacterized protein n=1 Tax=Kribbella orskensis TaxID=2512216 RepID=A0ABY2B8R9_9ACTN|nr:hypothetical protein EV642_13368 [Kribbella sp. VKM Ac-2500]TCO11405.1 hypothetical protein EV644_13168 [Kribbella orskensis]
MSNRHTIVTTRIGDLTLVASGNASTGFPLGRPACFVS